MRGRSSALRTAIAFTLTFAISFGLVPEPALAEMLSEADAVQAQTEGPVVEEPSETPDGTDLPQGEDSVDAASPEEAAQEASPVDGGSVEAPGGDEAIASNGEDTPGADVDQMEEGDQAANSHLDDEAIASIADAVMARVGSGADAASIVREAFALLVDAIVEARGNGGTSDGLDIYLGKQEDASRLFELVMGRLGIDCIQVVSGDGSRTWDMVRVDDAWYHVDSWAEAESRDAAEAAVDGGAGAASWLLVSDETVRAQDSGRTPWSALVGGEEVPSSVADYGEPADEQTDTKPQNEDTVAGEAVGQVASAGAAAAPDVDDEQADAAAQTGEDAGEGETEGQTPAADESNELPVADDVAATEGNDEAGGAGQQSEPGASQEEASTAADGASSSEASEAKDDADAGEAPVQTQPDPGPQVDPDPVASFVGLDNLTIQAGTYDAATIEAGDMHSGAILGDGSLWVWGDNGSGTVGDGTSTDRLVPVKIMDGVSAVSLGTNHSAAIKTDGSLWLWGGNGFGQIGDGTTTTRTRPVQVMEGVRDVALGASFTVALKDDGSVWTWGYDYKEALGNGSNGDSLVPSQIMTGAVAVAASGSRGAAIKADGTLWTWGWNYRGGLGDGTTTNRSTPVQVMTAVSAVSLGGFHGAAIRTDGSLWTWGLNDSGQLGDGTTTDRYSPTRVMDSVASVSLGMYYSIAVQGDGSLWAWGSNNTGGFCDGTTASSVSPRRVFDSVARAEAGWGHTLVLHTDGTLEAWGKNSDGQLGDGTTTSLHAFPSFGDISKAQVSVPSETYTGSAIKPSVSVDIGEASLTEGTDYQVVAYSNNVNAGTAKVEVRGIGSYRGTQTGTFAIEPCPVKYLTISDPAGQKHTGKELKPSVSVKFGSKTLAAGKDYTLSYASNVNPGTGSVTIEGKGNFTGSITKTFTITKTEIVPESTYPAYSKKLCYGVDNARLTEAMVTPGDDFALMTNDSDKTALIDGYYGKSTKVVVPCEIDGYRIVGITDVFAERDDLTEIYLPNTVDRCVSDAFDGCSSLKCLNLGSLKTALDQRGFSWLLFGCDSLRRLTMSDSADFPITLNSGGSNNLNIMREDVLDGIEYIYLGKSMSNVAENLFYGDSLKTIEVGKGHSLYSSYKGVLYSANGKSLLIVGSGLSGTCTIRSGCTGIGGFGFDNCSGVTRIVIPESMRGLTTSSFADCSPKLTIVAPAESYAELWARRNGRAIELSGKASTTYTVALSKASIKAPSSQTYTGKALTPAPKLTYGKMTLKKGTDYTVAYKGNVNAGTATVTITGKGFFSGSVNKTFKIAAKKVTPTVSLSKASFVYNGKAQKPKVTVKVGSKALAASQYAIAWPSNCTNAGTKSVKVTLKGNYSGAKTASYKVVKATNPVTAKATAKAASLKTLKSKAVVVVPLKVTKAQGKVTYAKSSGSSALTVNKSTGKVTVKKGTKKGTYTAKVKVTAAGNANYKSGSKTVTVKVVVK